MSHTPSNDLIKRLLIIAAIVAVISLFFTYENTHLVITEYSYHNEKIDASMNGYCIVQISDLHNAVFGKNNKSLIKKITDCNPDIIVLTGDLVDGSTHTNIKAAISFVKQAVEICPVYYITGNHEYYLRENKYNELMEGLTQSGVKILNDSSVLLSEKINLIGIDDNSIGGPELRALADEEKLNIVLSHEPQYIKHYAQNGADLVFTGHAHGGQFRLPIIGAVYAPDQGIKPQYSEGMIPYDNMYMIVSRGLGNSVFPLRLFNDPEIVCVRLYSE